MTKVAVIGAGIAGVATAYYLATKYGIKDITLIDKHHPMTFTSAQSGENYRNWWPHPSMAAFTDHSIDLLEKIARDSQNRINMNRRGYALATRNTNIDALLEQLQSSALGPEQLRFHTTANAPLYAPPLKPDWEGVPDGVDILQNQDIIRKTFPSYSNDIQTIVHIRRGGDISSQQLGMYMLEAYRAAGGKRIMGTVEEIVRTEDFCLTLNTPDGSTEFRAEKIVNAAGPFAGKIAAMLGVDLPIHHTFQQKIAFEDHARAIPRNMPFTIDLDPQKIDWEQDEIDMLRGEEAFRWLTETMPGSVHCRPDGGDNGAWIKLGWAYNHAPAAATWEPPLDDYFPDIVLRGAARLNPSLKKYYGQLPRAMHHYGGWYTLTEENWPLIGPMQLDGAYMNCALSGFGTMAACASAELCAAWVVDAPLPDYAQDFSLARYQNTALMAQLLRADKGLL